MRIFLRNPARQRAALAGSLLSLVGLLTAFHAPPATRPPGSPDPLHRLVQGLQNFYRAGRPEKTYLHLDKAVYTAGETIWLKAYVVDATQHQLDTLSRVLYVELLDNERHIATRRTLPLRDGLGHSDVVLPPSLAPGTYLLRAYTSWMRNAGPEFFYQRRLQVWPAAEPAAAGQPNASRARAAARAEATRASRPPDVQFFPEGGNLIEGLECVVAFKAVGADGTGVPVVGQVFDAQNQPVASFSSHHLGMGTFRLTPAPGQRYHAVLTGPGQPQTVPLPTAQPSGYSLRVATGANAFFVSIRQHGTGGPLLLLGQVRGNAAFIGRTQVKGDEPVVVRIPKSRFPAGIVQFTLFDALGAPLAERLAFAPLLAGLHVAITPDKPSYGPREPVRVRVAVADSAGRPVAAQLSLAVTEADSQNPLAESIASNLLLTSDLTGYVENPGYYFQNQAPETTQALDELLLTQGWRRFVWKEVLAGQLPPHDYGVERSLGLLGQITTPGGKPVAGSKLTLLQSEPITQSLSGTADADGRFLFNGLGGCDTSRFTIQARTPKGGQNVVVRLDDGPPTLPTPLPPLPALPAPAVAAAVRSGQRQALSESQFRRDTAKTIVLKSVAIVGDKQAAEDTRIHRLYNRSNATVLEVAKIPGASAATSIFQLIQGRVAGVQITGSEPNVSVIIRGASSLSGSSSPLFLIDGVPTDITAISGTPVTDVETVEIIKGAEATSYGSRGAGGIIAIYTHRGNPNYQPPATATPGTLTLRLPGYACDREFYVPRYDRPPASRPTADPRHATLYWSPTVRTDASGQAEVLFYTADDTGIFSLHAEGLAPGGQPVVGTGHLEVK